MSTSTKFISNQIDFLDAFRKLDPTIPIGEIIFFLHASLMSEPHLKQLSQEAGVPDSSASRYLTHLCEGREHKGIMGLGLLTTFENPMDRKQKLIQITDKGRQLLNELSKKQ